MQQPGWYPDPSGDFETRWWDGSRWTDSVANSGVQFTDALEPPTLPPSEVMLWQQGPLLLTTHRAVVPDPLNRRRTIELQLWMVIGVQVTRDAGQHLRGTGRIAIEVAYPGYGGPRHYVLKGIPDADVVAAMVRKWANRCRRAVSGA